MNRGHRRAAVVAAVVLLLAAACSSSRVLMPPRMDLHALGTIGLLDFTPMTRDSLNLRATREFLSSMHAAQAGVPVLELGDQAQVLHAVGRSVLDTDSIRAIGKRHRVDTLVVGVLDAQRIEPSVYLGRSADSLFAGASLEGALTVRMIDTRSGATVWSSSVSGRESLGNVKLAGGDLAGVTASDPSATAGHLVRQLVNSATSDFWPYWVRD
jgi:hypothetical protein